jgi:hypothetical protein
MPDISDLSKGWSHGTMSEVMISSSCRVSVTRLVCKTWPMPMSRNLFISAQREVTLPSMTSAFHS